MIVEYLSKWVSHDTHDNSTSSSIRSKNNNSAKEGLICKFWCFLSNPEHFEPLWNNNLGKEISEYGSFWTQEATVLWATSGSITSSDSCWIWSSQGSVSLILTRLIVNYDLMRNSYQNTQNYSNQMNTFTVGTGTSKMKFKVHRQPACQQWIGRWWKVGGVKQSWLDVATRRSWDLPPFRSVHLFAKNHPSIPQH